MSGGRFEYLDSQLKHQIFGYSDKPYNCFEDIEISELIWDVLNLIHEFDYYESGDSGRDDYIKAKNEFKEKWFKTSSNKRCKAYIDKAVAQLRNELYETFMIEDKETYEE